jgi:putative SOS response-associated peptidase YedK
MCGRFTHLYTWAQLHALYMLTLGTPPHNFEESYNVCPTDPVDAIVPHFDRNELVRMRWGLIPAWWSKAVKDIKLATFNARAETVQTKPFFREAFKKSRCLMPASGYYEWQDTPTGKQPYYFTRRDGQVMTLAGVCDRWHDRETDQTIRSCAMVIIEPNKFVGEVHDRLPVVLEADQFDAWLRGDVKDAVELMKPAGEDVLQKWPVSKRINSSRTPGDDPSLVEPVALAA